MKVLLLEDEPVVSGVVQAILKRRDYSLHEATTAEQALAIASMDGDLSLLIAAVNLHVGSGIDVALQLRAWMPRLKVILISGCPLGTFNDQDLTFYNELPSDSVRFLQKPFKSSDLLRIIDSFVWPKSLSPKP